MITVKRKHGEVIHINVKKNNGNGRSCTLALPQHSGHFRSQVDDLGGDEKVKGHMHEVRSLLSIPFHSTTQTGGVLYFLSRALWATDSQLQSAWQGAF